MQEEDEERTDCVQYLWDRYKIGVTRMVCYDNEDNCLLKKRKFVVTLNTERRKMILRDVGLQTLPKLVALIVTRVNCSPPKQTSAIPLRILGGVGNSPLVDDAHQVLLGDEKKDFVALKGTWDYSVNPHILFEAEIESSPEFRSTMEKYGVTQENIEVGIGKDVRGKEEWSILSVIVDAQKNPKYPLGYACFLHDMIDKKTHLNKGGTAYELPTKDFRKTLNIIRKSLTDPRPIIKEITIEGLLPPTAGDWSLAMELEMFYC